MTVGQCLLSNDLNKIIFKGLINTVIILGAKAACGPQNGLPPPMIFGAMRNVYTFHTASWEI